MVSVEDRNSVSMFTHRVFQSLSSTHQNIWLLTCKNVMILMMPRVKWCAPNGYHIYVFVHMHMFVCICTEKNLLKSAVLCRPDKQEFAPYLNFVHLFLC